MAGFTKLFSDIVDSSIWKEDHETRIVWVTMLALSNADGYIRGSVGWLASKSRVSPEKCAGAIKRFSEPDTESRTPDNDGRRIEILEDGWLILNYINFRNRLSPESQAVSSRERVQRHRERYKPLQPLRNITSPVPASASVSASSSGLSASMQASIDQSELTEIKEKIRSIRSSYESHQTIDGEDRAKLKKLYAREAELKKRLGREY